MLAIFSHSPINQCIQAATLTGDHVEMKTQLRDSPQLHCPTQGPTQEAGGSLQDFQRLTDLGRLGIQLLGTEQGKVDIRIAHIPTDTNLANRYHAHARIFYFPLHQPGQLALDLVSDTIYTAEFFWHLFLTSPDYPDAVL